MMLNGLGYQRSLAAHCEQIEADIARHRDKITRDRAEAIAQAERYEFEKRTFMEAEHAKNVAAEARMRRRQADLTAPNLYSRSGLMALLILACYFAGVFALAYFLGN
jgi:hypothetical protein